MTEEIDNYYNYQEELRKFKARKKKQDKLDKERENIIQPETTSCLISMVCHQNLEVGLVSA